MNRRRFLECVTLTALTACAAPLPAADGKGRSRKKGLGITTRRGNEWATKLQQVQARWFYSWGGKVPEGLPGGVEFVPMIFGRSSQEKISTVGHEAQEHRIGQLLAFNEPDQLHQSHMSVEQALELWPALMKTGLRLGSPGCVHPDNEWMKSFMKEADKRGLRVDFVCVHSYAGLNVDGFVNHMQAVHQLYQHPIWITELGVGDWQAKTREANRYQPEQIVRFMQQLLPRLDRMNIIERYAWFPAAPDSRALGPCALFNADGSLTKVGETYRSL